MHRLLSLAVSFVLVSCLAVHAQPASSSDDSSDPNTTRLLIGPTGRALEAGESYLDVIGISVPFVQIGITDRLSVGAGSPLLFPGLTPFEVYWLTPKFQLYSGRKTSAAVGVLHGNADSDIAGIVYAVATRGSADAAVTAGVGYAYRRSDKGYGAAPVVMIGAERRLSPHSKVLTENYAGTGFGMLSGGLRFWRGRTAFDFGVITQLETKFTAPFIRWTIRLTGGPDK